MTLAEKLMKVIEDISEEKIAEIIDFAEYLREKEKNKTRSVIDGIIDEYDEALKELAK